MPAPSVVATEEVVQLDGLSPEPESAQFQFTVTSVLFQPLLLAAGVWVGDATGTPGDVVSLFAIRRADTTPRPGLDGGYNVRGNGPGRGRSIAEMANT